MYLMLIFKILLVLDLSKFKIYCPKTDKKKHIYKQTQSIKYKICQTLQSKKNFENQTALNN